MKTIHLISMGLIIFGTSEMTGCVNTQPHPEPPAIPVPPVVLVPLELHSVSIPCGQIAPNLAVESFRDDRKTDRISDPDSYQESVGFADLPEGYYGPIGRPMDIWYSYPSNGGGGASAAVAITCTRGIKNDPYQGLTLLTINEHLHANNATNQHSSGSGFGPGGIAAENPTWHTTIDLPGGIDDHWSLELKPSLTTQFAKRASFRRSLS
jgi:hypothetical protein